MKYLSIHIMSYRLFFTKRSKSTRHTAPFTKNNEVSERCWYAMFYCHHQKHTGLNDYFSL